MANADYINLLRRKVNNNIITHESIDDSKEVDVEG
jgi:hypothetical protein